MPDKTEIVIRDMRTPKWIRGMVVLGFLVFFPIGLGIYAGSSAMQWAGFLLGVLATFAMAKQGTGEQTFNSPADARAYLDGIIQKENNNG